jgi:SAM-dependent methyltransferase
VRSPVSGRPLRVEGPHVLAADGERWPVVDDIPYLRTGREALVSEALAALDAGDPGAARVLLLADQDDWWPFDVPDAGACRAAVAAPTLREAMAALAYGPVGDYFAFRWSDPTFLSGLALLDAHGRGARRAFELACGIGHFLRELGLRGIAATGADVVWSKLWLARRFVAPQARLVCFDAAAPFPPADDTADVCLCHDALHYLPDKAHAVAELRRIGSTVLVGHAHNAAVENPSPGAPLPVEEYAALLPGARLYDDAQLGGGLAAGAPAAPRGADELAGAAAIALAWGPGDGARVPTFALPASGALRLNPLLDPDTLAVRWPSARYRDEYAALSGHLAGADPAAPREELARRRVLVDLPEAW